MNLKSFFLNNLFPILLIAITLVLTVVNWKPDTWLSGWDTLHPEFNFKLNLQRTFNGVWQEHQGLGATASQSHPVEFIRTIILMFFSLFLPLSFLRYAYFFICLILGPLGVYYFLNVIIFKRQKAKEPFSFLGALFYLLNLGTLQHFYVPLEMFAAHFASLGWLFLFLTQFLEEKKKKHLILFAIATLLASPMAHTATLFYAYFFILIIYLLAYLIQNHNKKTFKRIASILIMTLAVNSFWMLPNLYFIFNHGNEVIASKIHQLFTNEAIMQGREFANLKDLPILKNFLFNWGELANRGRFAYLLDEWQKHLQNPLVLSIGYLTFAIIVFGFIFSLIKKNKQGFLFAPIFIISSFFILLLSPSLEKIYFFLTEKNSLFQEALRFPFTKFSILLMFNFAVFFSLGLEYLHQLSRKQIKKLVLLKKGLFVLITLFLIIFMWPAFKGNLISPSMKVKIPNEYFQLFEWFDKQENGRIAKLPLHTFWGWAYYDWGYQGAGFMWFGLKQPLLDREFDRWSSYNEEAYRELSYALYSENLVLFEQLLDKYQIKWLLVDENVIAPGNEQKVLFFDETENLLKDSQKIKLTKTFGEKIKIYEVDLTSTEKIDSFISLVSTEKVGTELSEEIIKQIPKKINPFSFYTTKPNKKIDLNVNNLEIFPELCSPKDANQIFGLAKEANGFKVLAKNGITCVKLPLEKIILGNLSKNSLIEVNFESQINTDEKPHICLFNQTINRCVGQPFSDPYFLITDNIKNYQLQFSLDAIGESKQKEIIYENISLNIYDPSIIINNNFFGFNEGAYFNIIDFNRKPESCSQPQAKQIEGKLIKDKNQSYIQYLSQGGSICDHFSYPTLEHNLVYAIIVESKNIKGLPIRLCLTNYKTKRCDLYIELSNKNYFEKQVFLVPPMGGGSGYDINLNNHSVGNYYSINQLKSITILPMIDYQWLEIKENKKQEGKFITLNQSFEKNWRAFTWEKPLKIKSLGKPFIVNNWQNGWHSNENNGIHFFFLPQALEYLGFFIIFILIVLLFIF